MGRRASTYQRASGMTAVGRRCAPSAARRPTAALLRKQADHCCKLWLTCVCNNLCVCRVWARLQDAVCFDPERAAPRCLPYRWINFVEQAALSCQGGGPAEEAGESKGAAGAGALARAQRRAGAPAPRARGGAFCPNHGSSIIEARLASQPRSLCLLLQRKVSAADGASAPDAFVVRPCDLNRMCI